MATHCSVLAWRIPWTKELASYSPRGHRELDTTERPARTPVAAEQHRVQWNPALPFLASTRSARGWRGREEQEAIKFLPALRNKMKLIKSESAY